jgi:hypothetical protein
VAQSPTFGRVVLVFYRPKGGKERVESLIVVGLPLRACEAMRAYHRHHWIEEFWKVQKGVLQVSASSLRGRAGALAGVGIKIRAYVLLTLVRRVQVGKPMPGVFEVSRKVPIGVAIEDLLLIAECSLEGEWEGQVRYLPLR